MWKGIVEETKRDETITKKLSVTGGREAKNSVTASIGGKLRGRRSLNLTTGWEGYRCKESRLEADQCGKKLRRGGRNAKKKKKEKNPTNQNSRGGKWENLGNGTWDSTRSRRILGTKKGGTMGAISPQRESNFKGQRYGESGRAKHQNPYAGARERKV